VAVGVVVHVKGRHEEGASPRVQRVSADAIHVRDGVVGPAPPRFGVQGLVLAAAASTMGILLLFLLEAVHAASLALEEPKLVARGHGEIEIAVTHLSRYAMQYGQRRRL